MKPIKRTNAGKCSFCNSTNQVYIYDMHGYDIYQCENCLNIYVANMPSQEMLDEFYDGFLFCADEKNKEIVTQDCFKNWFDGFNLKSNAKMLDIGGGGGFFSYAFEYFSKGEATYIDLDPQACNFAREKMKLKNVINADIANLADITKDKYDFIYCRHVIEHLINPAEFITNAINLLSDGGVFILQCPNGLSYERIIEKDHRNNRIQILKNSNNLSKIDAWKILLSNKTAFGLEPIKHLWAFSPKALKLFLSQNNNINFKINKFSIYDDVYSPWMIKKNNLKILFQRTILFRILGGAHLVCTIRKNK